MHNVFQDSFMQTALFASMVVGIVCAYLGVFVVLRRVVFVGAALAQVSSAGVGLAMLIGVNPAISSILLTLGGVAAFSVKSTDRRTTQESYIGIGYAVASALAVLFVAKSAQGEAHMLDVLSGNILTVTMPEVWWMAGVGAIVILLHTLFHKQFLFSAFDRETAQASGIKSAWWDLFFFLLLGITISLGIKLAGMLLVFAFLVLPGVTALLLSQHLGRIQVIAVATSVVATVAGLYASVRLDLPSGPTIVAVSFILLLIAWLFSKFRLGD
ncbi:MAG: metal ABC transporter permease [Armatimonadota bacterium]